MTFYKNSEGYSDPSAGKALAAIARDDEHLCRQFKRMAEESGFEFPGQIWLRNKKSGFIFKNG